MWVRSGAQFYKKQGIVYYLRVLLIKKSRYFNIMSVALKCKA